MEPMKVKKTTFEKDLEDKEAYYAQLSPSERLEINEELRKRIWGDKYFTSKISGARVKIIRI